VWEREWLKDFHPMRFGQRLWICPGGQRPALDPAAAAPCLIELDPGLAFGTGTHPTTALCLEWLDGATLQDRFVVDYGCGSGVLAIAALKLGACAALAIDIDPQALLATRENAARNDVSERLIVGGPDEAQRAPAEVLLANILAEPLLELAPALAERVAAGGAVVLSGILQRQAAPVASRYAAWFDMRPATVRDDWALLYGVRRS
jgi:ribosomal protein L11 methyltransferase